MQIRKRIQTSKPTNGFEKDLERELLSFSLELSDILNKGIKFADNMEDGLVTVADSGNADTEFEVSHTLKRVPIGYLLINIDKAGIVYDSGTTWTTTKIYLKCNVANCALKLFLL